jgi:glutamyl-tRNA synthetase
MPAACDRPGQGKPGKAGSQARGEERGGHGKGQPDVVVPRPDSSQRHRREHSTDDETGSCFVRDDALEWPSRERELTHGDRFALGPNRVPQVDDRGYEKGDGDMGLEGRLEMRNECRRASASGETDQQPGQTVACAAQWRRVDGIARTLRFGPDPGQALQVFDMFAPQHIEQRLCWEDSDQMAAYIDHRQAAQTVGNRQVGGLFLIGTSPHCGNRVEGDCRQEGIGRTGQGTSGRHQPDKSSALIDQKYRIDVFDFDSVCEPGPEGPTTLIGSGPDHRSGEVLGNRPCNRFGMRREAGRDDDGLRGDANGFHHDQAPWIVFDDSLESGPGCAVPARFPHSNSNEIMVRTRFAPSPTGFLHIGGARTALFAWAFARHFGGTFILRIEDTDLERSTPEAVQAILDGMRWLALEADEGPFFQTQRMERYREVIAQMLAAGTAYHCYCTPDELDAMREDQRARGLKPRYDGRWRPENAAGRTPPEGVKPVVRFRNPDTGGVAWEDMVKGPIRIANDELDDLIIARSDGTPTYNFCVVVDDWDMRITHVIRGDDHVNNTPRQINILSALGASLPRYGHVPMIHGDDGQKLSKRHGAVSVMQYEADGYLPEAVINYLARLGWSHGDDELFSREQLVAWFDGEHLSSSPSQFNTAKLRWVNQHYLKHSDNDWLAGAIRERLVRAGIHAVALSSPAYPQLAGVCGLLKDRAATLNDLADEAHMFFAEPKPREDDLAQHMTPAARAALAELATSLDTVAWTTESIAAAIKPVLAAHALKMPQLAIPLRLKVFGLTRTPSVDACLALMPRSTVIERLRA